MKRQNDGRRMNFMDEKNRSLAKAIRDFGTKKGSSNEKEPTMHGVRPAEKEVTRPEVSES
jgi:hypothetical protein